MGKFRRLTLGHCTAPTQNAHGTRKTFRATTEASVTDLATREMALGEPDGRPHEGHGTELASNDA